MNIDFDTLNQCFPTFFGSRHPHKVMKIFGGTHSQLIRSTDQGMIAIGGTYPDISSKYPSVPQHPGWEQLHYTIKAFDSKMSHLILFCLYK